MAFGDYAVDYGTWGGAPSGESIPIQGTFGNYDTTSTLAGGSTASSADLIKALQGMGKGFEDQQAKNTQQGAPAAAAIGNTPTGNPRRAINLNDLVQILRQRQLGLQNSAIGQGQMVGKPIMAPQAIGLLGF